MARCSGHRSDQNPVPACCSREGGSVSGGLTDGLKPSFKVWKQNLEMSRKFPKGGCKLNRLNSVVGEYAGACVQVARDCGVDVLDLWTLMQKDTQDFSSYLSDGLHLSPKGNEFLFSHLWPLIEKRVCSLPLLLPYWRDIAEAQPERSLLGDGDH